MPAPELFAAQEHQFFSPHHNVEQTIDQIYAKNKFSLGWPQGKERRFEHIARPHTVIIAGIALGDEGKGRFVDNKITTLLAQPDIKQAYVVRYQGGNNAGHTVEDGDIKLALHLVPSGVLHEQATGIMDRGMVVNTEDLHTEVTYIEQKTGSLSGRLFLSEEAILNTDLERAEEFLNNQRAHRSQGGTRRGIGPSYAHNLDRRGLKIYDLLDPQWKDILGIQYSQYEKEFAAFGLDLAKISVPDFSQVVTTGKDQSRTVGSKRQFLKRLEEARAWLLDCNLVTNTFLLHADAIQDPHTAVVFEGAQAAGLDAWLGTRPDVTASNTRTTGIEEGTGLWKRENIYDAIGILKVPYTSSVGSRRLPTHIDLPKDLSDLPEDATPDQQWAAFVRDAAHEYGTTTGRPRDITFLDLGMLRYNARMSGVEMLATTHLDVSKEGQDINVCTYYTDNNGTYIPYQPGLRYLAGVIPQYVTVPGWDGDACRSAKTVEELPENAQKFLAFLQKQTGYPIVATTTGPRHNDYIEF